MKHLCCLLARSKPVPRVRLVREQREKKGEWKIREGERVGSKTNLCDMTSYLQRGNFVYWGFDSSFKLCDEPGLNRTPVQAMPIGRYEYFDHISFQIWFNTVGWMNVKLVSRHKGEWFRRAGLSRPEVNVSFWCSNQDYPDIPTHVLRSSLSRNPFLHEQK